MTVASTTLLEEIYKIRYSPDGLTEYFTKESEILTEVPIKNDFGGWKWWKTFKTNTVRGSTTFGTALANRNVPNFVRPEIHRSEDHVIVSVGCEAARAARRGGEYALIDELDDAIQSSMEELARQTDAFMAGNGGGSIGQIATGGIAGNVITLADPAQIYLFSEQMLLQVSANDGTGTGHTLRDSGNTHTVSSIDQDAGTVTVSAIGDVSGTAAADYLFRDGDFDQGAQRVLQGFFAWCPHTAPSGGDSFFTIDRSTNVGALSGSRIDGDAASPVDTIKELAAKMKRNRARRGEYVCFINPTRWTEVDQVILAKQYYGQENKPKMGAEGFVIKTVLGDVRCVASSAFAEDQGIIFRRESVLLRSLDGFPHPVDDDGDIWHLEPTSDSLQARHRYYAQFAGLRPQDMGALTFG